MSISKNKKVNGLNPTTGAILGALMGGLGLMTVGQKLSDTVSGSYALTVGLLVLGLVLGGIVGRRLGKAQNTD